MGIKPLPFAQEYSAEEFKEIRKALLKWNRLDSRCRCSAWRWFWILVWRLPKPRGSNWLSQDAEDILQYNYRWAHSKPFGGYTYTLETITYVRREDGTWAYDPEQTTEVFSRMVEFQAAPRDWDTPERQAELEAWGMAVQKSIR